VFSATHTRTKEKVAIKKMKLKAQNLKTIINEIGMMKGCKHDNIVQYIDSYLVADELWVWRPGVYCHTSIVITLVQVVMEFMGGGCLTEVLDQYRELQLTEEHMANICVEVRSIFILFFNLTICLGPKGFTIYSPLSPYSS
jgi:serine/threonine protein kinase